MVKANDVVLVHGAWADGSCWEKVIPYLDKAGLNVTAVQLPLTSLEDDVATLGRAIALESESIVLVGHSYGGAVITEGGSDPKVRGLVYIAAFGPDVGESAGSLLASVPPTSLASELRQDSNGFLKMTRQGYYESFAQDLNEIEKLTLFCAHAPTHGRSLGGEITRAAWREKPSSYVIASGDRAIDPRLQRTMCERMAAHATTVATSHLAMLAEPQRVAEVIVAAAVNVGS